MTVESAGPSPAIGADQASGTYAHVHSYVIMARYNKRDINAHEMRSTGRSEVRHLVREAEASRVLRLERMRASDRLGGLASSADGHRLRAAEMLEHALTAPLPSRIACGGYLNRVASLCQISTPGIGVLLTSAADLRIGSPRARVMAVALAEVMAFAAAGIGKDVRLTIHLVVAKEPGRLVVALSASDGFQPVATAGGIGSLLRARAIIEAMGGDFQRGVDADRMVIGMTAPFSDRRRDGCNEARG